MTRFNALDYLHLLYRGEEMISVVTGAFTITLTLVCLRGLRLKNRQYNHIILIYMITKIATYESC